MPIDHKRINGPENSVSYRFYSKVNLKTYEEKLQELYSNDKIIRKDNRNCTETRQIYIKSGIVSKAKGSAYMELGKTKVMVTVFDPREIPKQNTFSVNGDLFCDFKYSPFSCTKRRLPQTDAEEKSLAQSMKRALKPAVCLHEFSNFQIDIFANVLENDGGVLGAVITCAGLALANASIPMYDIITASTIGVVNGEILVDPTAFEEDVCLNYSGPKDNGTIMLAKLSMLEQITEIWQSGSMTIETFSDVHKQLLLINDEYVTIMKQILVKDTVRQLDKLTISSKMDVDNVDNNNDDDDDDKDNDKEK